MMLIVVVATMVVTSKKYFPCSGICFRANPKTSRGHKHFDCFDCVCGDKEKIMMVTVMVGMTEMPSTFLQNKERGMTVTSLIVELLYSPVPVLYHLLT